ncbi:hypothetical protein WMF04_46395 [Sorangium sp. So ce260]|uniref:hypothetical protein n=1 Tax=Sorangium sp. So ce260 TaxID=3133291 RepID=UPI003F602492
MPRAGEVDVPAAGAGLEAGGGKGGRSGGGRTPGGHGIDVDGVALEHLDEDEHLDEVLVEVEGANAIEQLQRPGSRAGEVASTPSDDAGRGLAPAGSSEIDRDALVSWSDDDVAWLEAAMPPEGQQHGIMAQGGRRAPQSEQRLEAVSARLGPVAVPSTAERLMTLERAAVESQALASTAATSEAKLDAAGGVDGGMVRGRPQHGCMPPLSGSAPGS